MISDYTLVVQCAGHERIRIDPDTTSVVIDAEATHDDFRRVLEWMSAMGQQYDRVLARLILEGRKAFGETAVQQAFESIDLDYKTVRRANVIASGLPPACWDMRLTDDVAKVLAEARLDAPRKEYWGKLAEREYLDALELKTSIEQGRMVRRKEIMAVRGEEVRVKTMRSILADWESESMQPMWRAPHTWPQERIDEVIDMTTPLRAWLDEVMEANK